MLAPRAALPAIAVLAVAAWLIAMLGAAAGAAARALPLLALAILPWGLLLTRGLAGGLLLGSERVVLAGLVGYPIAASLYFLLSRADWQAAFLPLCALAAAALAFAPRTPAAPPAREDRLRPHWSLALFAPLAVFTIMRWSRPFAPVDGGLAYEHSVDHTVLLSFYWELVRGVPPRELPLAGGIPFPAYHLLSFMPGLLMLRSTQLPVTSVGHVLSPFLKLLLLIGAVYLLVRVRTRDGRAATAVVPAMFCAAYAFESLFNERLVVGPPPHYDFLRNEATGGGLVVWATIACLLALQERAWQEGDADGARRLLLLASLFAGLSYAFKAQLFLLFGGALGLAMALLPWRGRARDALASLLVMGCTFGVLFWLSRGPGSVPTVEWRPGLFAELYVYPNLRRDPAAWVRGPLASFFEGFPGGWGYLLAVPLAILRVVAFSPLVVGFLVFAARRARALPLGDMAAALAFALALPMGYGLAIVSYYRGASPFEFRQAAHGLWFLGVLIDVVAGYALVQRLGRDAGSWLLAAAALASVAAAPVLFNERAYVPGRAGIVLANDEQCALLFLRRNTPPEALVVSARPGPQRLNRQGVVAGFAGRRTVMEVVEKDVDWKNDRERDIRRLYSTSDASLSARILDRYGVDYVLESDALPIRFPTAGLDRVYENGRFRVWHVAAAPPRNAALPEIFQRPDELRCDNVR